MKSKGGIPCRIVVLACFGRQNKDSVKLPDFVVEVDSNQVNTFQIDRSRLALIFVNKRASDIALKDLERRFGAIKVQPLPDINSLHTYLPRLGIPQQDIERVVAAFKPAIFRPTFDFFQPPPPKGPGVRGQYDTNEEKIRFLAGQRR